MSGRPRALSYANVMSTLAVVLALAGGTAYAASTINGSSIANRSITGHKLKLNTVTGKEVKESTLKAVNAGKLGGVAANGFVRGKNLRVLRVSKQQANADGSIVDAIAIPGFGTFSTECSNSGNDFLVQYDNTTAGTTHYSRTVIWEDDSSHLGATLGNTVPAGSTTSISLSNVGNDSGFEQHWTLTDATATRSADVQIGGVTQVDSGTNCQFSIVAVVG